MLLSGFTFIRNAKKYDFPIKECIESMLAVVDELIINVGKSDDGTEEFIASLESPKIKIINSVWDDSKTDRGLVLSEQTNIALDACSGKWALYLQADEALDEREHALIRAAVEAEDREPSPVDGFRFRYLHFYGGYTLVQRPWNWYPAEIRVIRVASGARSYGDAQTFRLADDRELRTKLLDAHVFHYGHAREPEKMAQKIRYFHRFWHGDQHGIQVAQAYKLDHKNLVWYWGNHPHAYESRVASGISWSPRPDQVVGRKFKHIVIAASERELALAEELQRLIASHAAPPPQVKITTGLSSWIRTIFKQAFTRKRSESAIVDLRAETRNAISFIDFALDALAVFGWRVAHSPNGTLSSFRAKLYSAVNWGRHEKTDLGFIMPRSEHVKGLARWLGINIR